MAGLLCIGASLALIGKRRSKMEDVCALSSEPSPEVAVVADGIGSALHGDIVAKMAVDCVLQHHGRCRIASAPASAESRLLGAFGDAQSQVFGYGKSNAYLLNVPKTRIKNGQPVPWDYRPGTTMAATAFDGSDLHGMWIGDTRAYLARAGTVRILTQDHSPLPRYYPGMSTDELRYLKSNVVLRYIGGDVAKRADADTPEYFRLPLQAGDMVVLCSDGVSGELDERGGPFDGILLSGKSPADICADLSAAVMATEARDNATGVVLSFRAA